MPSRTAAVLADINADVIALQEVIGSNATNPGHAEELGAALGMGWVMAPARHLRGHLFGNVVLSRLPIRHHTQYDLSWKDREPRCCQRVDLAVTITPSTSTTCISACALERRHQAVRLAAIVHDRRVEGPKIVLGDFNEWTRGLATKMLSGKAAERRISSRT